MTYQSNIPEQGESVIIIAGCLIDGSGRAAVGPVGVILENERISFVGEVDEALFRVKDGDYRVLDASNNTLTPGLIDGHAHVAWGEATQPGWSACRGDSHMTLLWAAANCARALRAGVTSIRDCGAPRGVTLRLRDAIAGGIWQGARLLVCGPCITTTAGHGEEIGVNADTPDELRRTVRQLCREGVDFVKVMATGGLIDPQPTNRRRAQYSLDELRIVADEAHRLNRRVVAHANATEGIRRAVMAGIDTIAHCNWLAEIEGELDYDTQVAQLMLDQGTEVDLNVEAAMADIATRDGVLPAHAGVRQPRDRWELLSDLRDRGAKIFLTSDRFGPGIADFPLLLRDAARRWQLPPEELIWRVSGLPGESMGVSTAFGTVTAGAPADLVIFEGDLRTGLDGLASPLAVFKSGRAVSVRGFEEFVTGSTRFVG